MIWDKVEGKSHCGLQHMIRKEGEAIGNSLL